MTALRSARKREIWEAFDSGTGAGFPEEAGGEAAIKAVFDSDVRGGTGDELSDANHINTPAIAAIAPDQIRVAGGSLRPGAGEFTMMGTMRASSRSSSY
jgi:hypothetical protein